MTATNKVDSGASMSVPTAGENRLVIVGATGMVGGCALRYALDNSAVECVTSIGRKRLGISHPKLKEVLHQNFADCSALADALLGQDAAVYCLGTYTGSVSDAELRAITADYTIEFARVLRDSSPNAAFSFLSGNGADPTGRSRLAFARYKGQAEKALLAAGFPRVYSSSRGSCPCRSLSKSSTSSGSARLPQKQFCLSRSDAASKQRRRRKGALPGCVLNSATTRETPLR
jgi:hypothetical protein